jgi:hypothetical protein
LIVPFPASEYIKARWFSALTALEHAHQVRGAGLSTGHSDLGREIVGESKNRLLWLFIKVLKQTECGVFYRPWDKFADASFGE